MRPTEQCLARIRVRAWRSLKPITLGTTHRATGVVVVEAEGEVAAEAEVAEGEVAAEVVEEVEEVEVEEVAARGSVSARSRR